MLPKITDMYVIFCGASKFNQDEMLPKVTDMHFMFCGAAGILDSIAIFKVKILI